VIRTVINALPLLVIQFAAREFAGSIRARHQRIDAEDCHDLIEAKRLLAPLQGRWRRHPERYFRPTMPARSMTAPVVSGWHGRQWPRTHWNAPPFTARTHSGRSR